MAVESRRLAFRKAIDRTSGDPGPVRGAFTACRSSYVSHRKLWAFGHLRRCAGSPSLGFVNTWSTSGPDSNRRRSQRVILSVPVTVSGQGPKAPFSEETKTLVVNAHGALVTLAAKVSQGQQLELKSVTNPESQSCKVVYVGPTVQGQTQVGVEFLKPAPHFWHVAFPPENWTPVADDGATVKTPGAAATRPPVTAPAKAPAPGPTKTPVTAPVKASKP